MASALGPRCGYQCLQCQLKKVVSRPRGSYNQSRALSTSSVSWSSRRSGGGPTRTSKTDQFQEQKRLDAKKPPPPPPSFFNFPKFPESLDHDARLEYDSLGPEQKAEEDEKFRSLEEQLQDPEIIEVLREGSGIYPAPYEKDGPEEKMQLPQTNIGLFAMGETEIQDGGEDDDELAEGDDITTLGHLELEAHRNFRKYARIIAWEMPLLFNLSKPFAPPSQEEALRFRYTTYMGEEHPAEKKVVVQFNVADLKDLTDVQKSKLIKLSGPRYNPQTGMVKMSCESFDTQAQNTRYLGDLVKKLIAEAKDPSDDMADIPFDFRHHKSRPIYQFPEAWKLTPQRVLELEARRAMSLPSTDNPQAQLEGKLSEIEQSIEQLTSSTHQTVGEEVLVPR